MSRHTHNHTLNAARAVLVIAGSFVAASARDSRTSFTVGATVMPVARLELQSAPAEIQISSVDLKRGFVDVPEPTALAIRSNSPTGFVLDVVTMAPILSSMIIQGLGSEQSLGAEGGTIVQRWESPHPVNLLLKFRLGLAPGLAEGRYPWPMRVTVRPLESI